MIDKKLTKSIVYLIEEHLNNYLPELSEALESDEDGKVKISLPVALVVSAGGKITVQTGISFVKDRVKAQSVHIYDQQQPGLWESGD